MLESQKEYKLIEQNCINCNRCYNSCIMLQGLGKDFEDILTNNTLMKGKNKCCLCGLCSEVCPMKLDICAYYKNLKQEKINPLINTYVKRKHRKLIEKTSV